MFIVRNRSYFQLYDVDINIHLQYFPSERLRIGLCLSYFVHGKIQPVK